MPFQAQRVLSGFSSALRNLKKFSKNLHLRFEVLLLTLFVSLFGTEANRFRGIPAVAASSVRFKEQLFRAFAKPDETKGPPFVFFGYFDISFSYLQFFNDYFLP